MKYLFSQNKKLSIILFFLIPMISFGFENPLGNIDMNTAIIQITQIVQTILIIVSVLYILYAGLMFVTARGDTAKLIKARNALFFGLIGAMLIIASQTLVNALKETANNIFKK